MSRSNPTFTQACTSVLVLALTAPTDAQALEAGELADWFAARLTDEQVKACKSAAIQIAEGQMRNRGAA